MHLQLDIIWLIGFTLPPFFKTSKQDEGLITPFPLTNFKNIQMRWRGIIPLYSPPLYFPLFSFLSKLPNRP